MCWPRSFCCRCPGSSSFPWPASLTFGRTPRRLPLPQPTLLSPWPCNPLPMTPPPPQFIPQTRWDSFDEPPPFIGMTPAPCAPMTPFLPPILPSPQAWPQPQINLSPELCSPRGTHPYLEWDITQFPSSAQLCTTPYSRKPAPLDGGATFPPTHLLTLSFADNPVTQVWEQQWGPIFARGQGAHALTVEDVLDAVYRYFNTPLTPEDRELVSPHAWGLICDAYYARLPRSPNMRAYDARRGALRLDVLTGTRKFSGLQCVGRDHFRLTLTA
ncbi:hypothetical protein B0H17DRAFT_386349 [Mycena rosella]|uniref:DUF6699 domain-containing protein n=1 Tax=Mycena rosella TaxID=1033263 RepID=A0AAD7G373_MYCRO|nr:hypothetical protein B0H17DRAFT_386349 [Mycena rosella]